MHVQNIFYLDCSSLIWLDKDSVTPPICFVIFSMHFRRLWISEFWSSRWALTKWETSLRKWKIVLIWFPSLWCGFFETCIQVWQNHFPCFPPNFFAKNSIMYGGKLVHRLCTDLSQMLHLRDLIYNNSGVQFVGEQIWSGVSSASIKLLSCDSILIVFW